MAHPQYIHYLLLVLVALPSVPVNRLAGIVIAAWIPGQIAWMGHLPAAPTDMVMDILAVGAGAALARNTPELMVTAMFVPMAMVNASEAVGGLHPYYAWWILFWLSVLQVIVLPFGNDWDWLRRKVRVA